MARVGLAPHGDDQAVRWVAVRHSDDHVHLVAALVRQDRRTCWPATTTRSPRPPAATLSNGTASTESACPARARPGGSDMLHRDEVGLAEQTDMRRVGGDNPVVGVVPPQHRPVPTSCVVGRLVVGVLTVPHLPAGP
jgi:hypothetical protein